MEAAAQATKSERKPREMRVRSCNNLCWEEKRGRESFLDKSFPVQTDEHFLAVARYVERNPLRAKLVERAEEWRWSSLWRRSQGDPQHVAFLSEWPVVRPRNWVARTNRPETATELEVLRCSVQRGRPFGNETWVQRMTKRFGLESTLRPRGRPKGS